MSSLFQILHGDALEILKSFDDNSIDAVVTDPPYGLSKAPDIAEVLTHWLNGDDYVHRGGGFMGKTWDSFVPGPSVWKEVYRVLKPGGHILCFAGTRTVDLMGISLRLGGFEIRDTIQWLYGSGFPKSANISKQIDKAAGAEREVVGTKVGRAATPIRNLRGGAYHGASEREQTHDASAITAPATPEAQQWDGWGTALKPANEPIILARKPFKRTVANNVLTYGTGALNIDGCRIGTEEKLVRPEIQRFNNNAYGKGLGAGTQTEPTGRWPANVILDEEAGALLDEQSGISKSSGGRTANISKTSTIYGGGKGLGQEIDADEVRGDPGFGDVGGASRFFYCAKSSRKERGEGNGHPTVKPIALMQYLVRLITPPGGTVLDPYCGSGTTGIAALNEGFQFTGIEMERDYCRIAWDRISHITCEQVRN